MGRLGTRCAAALVVSLVVKNAGSISRRRGASRRVNPVGTSPRCKGMRWLGLGHRASVTRWAAVVGLILVAGCNQPTAQKPPRPLVSTGSPAPASGSAVLPPTPSPQPVAWADFLDVAFATPELGWDTGARSNAAPDQVFVRRTSDGGRTWTDPSILNVGPQPTGVGIRFGRPDRGWLYGPGLWTSSDGGLTWRDTGLGGLVYAVAPVGSSVWVLRAECRDEAGCPARLFDVNTDGTGRRVFTGLPASPGMQGLLRVSANLAFAFESPIIGVSGAIWVTRDAGSTWAKQPIPCPAPEFNAVPSLATLDGRVLWIACPTEPSAGQQLKAVYLSLDGGATWRVRASNLVQQPTAGSIPSSGYIRQLTLSTPSTGFLSLGRGGMFRSVDWGATWTDTGLPNAADAGVFSPWFVDALHGWAVTDGPEGGVDRRLWSTSDGGASWTELPAPSLPAR